MTRVILAILMISSIAGCNSTAEQETTLTISCSSNDWQALGYSVATSGNSIREFDKYITQCGETLQLQAKSLYSLGYEQGLVDYCTYENGYAIGMSKKPFENHCTYELNEEFERGIKMAKVDLSLKRQTLSYYEEELTRQHEIQSGDLMSAKGKDGP